MVNYLNKIDSLIENEYSNIKKQYLSDLAIFIQKYFEIDVKKEGIDFLFSKENDTILQRFISHCLIRIIGNKNYGFISDHKHIIFKHIQSTSPEIYHLMNINDKTETYEKEKRLKEFIFDREKEFKEYSFFDGSLSNINKFQQDYRRLTSARKNLIIHDYTHDLLSKSSLDGIFNKLSEYITTEEANKYGVYLTLKETLEQFIDEASKIETKYAIEYIIQPFTKIKECIFKSIEKSPHNIPTNLKLFKTEKKYPLTEGIKSSFSIIVSNLGKGIAKDVKISILDYDQKSIYIPKTDLFLGNIAFENVVIEFDYETIKNTNSIILELFLSWNSATNNLSNHTEIIELQSQLINIEWEKVKNLEPYNLEPVQYEPELIGRENILQKLKNMQTLPIGSAYIYGQRRVGKTSIVKTLLNSNTEKNLLIHYVEAGDWNDAHSASNSMDNLGEKICKKIKRFNPKFSSLDIPKFEGSFNKITDFLDEVEDIDSGFKLVIILDEFDRISRNLYERGEVGQAFVLTLRAISNRPQFGFILVGGEKLEYILSQWQEFNKFSPVRVDYFSKERDWEDFNKLVKKPVEAILEIADSAINYLYDETAGNPYFTKKICMELFALMIENRDIHVTSKETLKATKIARDSANIGATDFSHFWEDGIKGKIEKEEETSLKRRKVLISITQAIRAGKKIQKETISDSGLELGLNSSDTDKYLAEFEQRKILYSRENDYIFVVNFFKEWLIAGGMEKIIATFEEEERVQIHQQIEEKTKVKSEEIQKILPKLKTYKGTDLKIETIRQWLEQFNDVFDQRLVFKLLENFKLYNELEIREKLELLFNNVKRELNKRGNIRTLDSAKKKRDDILVTYLDKSPAKGGSYFTKLFADQNVIYSDNVCTPELIEKKINEKKALKGLVIIDDFAGSGTTLVDNIKSYFDENTINLIKSKDILIIFGIVAGFLEAKEFIEKEISSLNFNFKIIICDIYNHNEKCFSIESNIFSNPAEMRKAKFLCEQKGEILVAKNPLGYADGQCLIAFPMNCPNNTLPIFWKKTDTWMPLFGRN